MESWQAALSILVHMIPDLISTNLRMGAMDECGILVTVTLDGHIGMRSSSPLDVSARCFN